MRISVAEPGAAGSRYTPSRSLTRPEAVHADLYSASRRDGRLSASAPNVAPVRSVTIRTLSTGQNPARCGDALPRTGLMSRLEPCRHPGAPHEFRAGTGELARPRRPIVDARGLAHPQLDAFGPHAIAAPARGT